MAKITYKEKHLTGSLFIVSEDEYMSLMVGNVAACGRHGAEAVAESLHLIHKYQAEREEGMEGGRSKVSYQKLTEVHQLCLAK